MAHLEIEKKFLVPSVPSDIHHFEMTEIDQGYLAITEDDCEVRIRKKGNRFFQTAKQGRGIQRTEVEIELSLQQFQALWPLTENRRICKKRYYIPAAGHMCELDIFCDRLEGLVIVEVEFANFDESHRFEPPAWFGREVTTDERYKNKNLAVFGMPK